MRAYAYISSFCRLLSKVFARPSHSIPPLRVMIPTYTCTVSTEPGKAPEDAKAHHIKDKNGRFLRFNNPYPSFGIFTNISFFQGLSMYFRNRLAGRLPVPDASNANIPIVKPSFAPSRGVVNSNNTSTSTSSGNLRATWLGHATYLVEFPSGFRALFDPVFEEQYSALGPKRYTPAACQPADLPEIDAVFISHNHHDHLSYPSVMQLVGRFPNLHFFVGQGLARWFRDSGISAVTEMDWWDDAEVVLERNPDSKTDPDGDKEGHDDDKTAAPEQIKARISCLPSQHGSLRNGFDYGHTLWASWAVTSGGKSAWFAGDTGYRCVPEGMEELGPGFETLPRTPQFAQIGELRGPFDVGLLPIGAYYPRFMYSGVHASPYDAVEIFEDTRCRRAVGMHWGAFVLTSERVDQPPEDLRAALRIKGIAERGVFDVCAVGESLEF
ncbi:hypothetical protein VMCG_04863 [Cytospora schulzeri]|uniref:Metallo-beta-lactamase domain-containing protein n=1 Tax=Cytospora schulzeri TaxID=448051 RepID=A0A423WN08_9PEZI|nr:hypothetical protein VMCG_04863 [Valsa malicola]